MDVKDLFSESSASNPVAGIVQTIAPYLKDAGVGLGYAISEGIDEVVDLLFPNN